MEEINKRRCSMQVINIRRWIFIEKCSFQHKIRETLYNLNNKERVSHNDEGS